MSPMRRLNVSCTGREKAMRIHGDTQGPGAPAAIKPALPSKEQPKPRPVYLPLWPWPDMQPATVVKKAA